MSNRLTTFSTACLALLVWHGSMWAADEPVAAPAAAAAKAPIILLKLDDLGSSSKDPRAGVSDRWQKVTDFLEEQKIKASYGIICESLALDQPAFIAWLKARQDKGMIEFWNHGYYNAFKPATGSTNNGQSGQFDGSTLEQQREFLTHGQQLFKEKMGNEMHSFGPHSGKIDATTYAALEACPEITMVWFYGPPKGTTTSKFVFERTINLEVPIFNPNPEDVKARYLKSGHSQAYIAMQGHPNQWDEAKLAAFKTTVTFLREQGCTFMTATEYLAAHPPAKQ